MERKEEKRQKKTREISNEQKGQKYPRKKPKKKHQRQGTNIEHQQKNARDEQQKTLPQNHPNYHFWGRVTSPSQPVVRIRSMN